MRTLFKRKGALDEVGISASSKQEVGMDEPSPTMKRYRGGRVWEVERIPSSDAMYEVALESMIHLPCGMPLLDTLFITVMRPD